MPAERSAGRSVHCEGWENPYSSSHPSQTHRPPSRVDLVALIGNDVRPRWTEIDGMHGSSGSAREHTVQPSLVVRSNHRPPPAPPVSCGQPRVDHGGGFMQSAEPVDDATTV